MSFSTVLRLQDVDDFIAPAQTCIRPVKIDKEPGKTKSVRVEEDGSYTALTEDGKSYKLTKASITLNDCLACSGCITTAESVLISQHSCESLTRFLMENREKDIDLRQVVVVSISPQSLTSLTGALINKSDPLFERRFHEWKTERYIPSTSDINLKMVRIFLTDYLESLGVHLVLDTSWVRDIVLRYSAAEFVSRFSRAYYAERSFSLPLFSGICPGWICYAEKTHGTTETSGGSVAGKSFSVIPYLSKHCSPQQAIGRLIKLKERQSVFHITIMPCFDKKLEASRQDFLAVVDVDNSHPIPDVDFVLTTSELLQLICEQSSGKICSVYPPVLDSSRQELLFELKCIFETLLNETDVDSPDGLNVPVLYRHGGSGSGGYAAHVFSYAAIKLYDIWLPSCLTDDPRVLVRELQNRDLQEMLLFVSESECEDAKKALDRLPNKRIPYRQCKVPQNAVLAFAVANGFRHIQNLVQRLKVSSWYPTFDPTNPDVKVPSAVFPFDYVEVMACPGGCLNGGGQVKGSVDRAKSLYYQLPVHEPMALETTRRILDYMIAFDPALKILETKYRQVPKIEIINSSALQW